MKRKQLLAAITIVTGCALGASGIAYASGVQSAGVSKPASTLHQHGMMKASSKNYRNCVAQKMKVAEQFCSSDATSNCAAEKRGVRSACHSEVRKGLWFKPLADTSL